MVYGNITIVNGVYKPTYNLGELAYDHGAKKMRVEWDFLMV